jgi:hypothetical protein
MLYYNVHAASLCNPLNANTHAHKTAGTYTTIFLQRHPGSVRKKRINLNPAQLLLRHVRVFFLLLVVGRSVGASAAPTRLVPGLFSRKYTHRAREEEHRAFLFFLPLSRLNRRCNAG